MASTRETRTAVIGRLVIVAVAALALLAFAPAARSADFDWSTARFLHQAHQGGEDEAPSNTMFAFSYALAQGADMLEIDVHLSEDGQIVVGHDDTVDRTTDGHGPVRNLTLVQLRRLDSAYWFVPGRSTVHGLPDASYPYRGVRTGKRSPPAGYDREDFRIPTLREVMRAYPHVPLNVEIKGADQAEKFRVADALSALLRTSGRRDIVVVSFDQASIDRFHRVAPRIPVAAGVDAAIKFLLLGQDLPPGTVALQLPYSFDLGSIGIKIPIVQDLPVDLNLAQRWVTDRAHSKGIAVHYWEVPENDAAYRQVLGVCGDGIMTTSPRRFEAFVDGTRAPRVGGQGGPPGADGCGGAPPPPPPGCRVQASELVPGHDGHVTVRLERWGDLRAACDATVTLQSADPLAVPGAAAGRRRAASRAARHARAATSHARSATRRARATTRRARSARGRHATSRHRATARRRAAAARSAARRARSRAHRARARSHRAARAAKAGAAVVDLGTAHVRTPAGRMGSTVDVPLSSDGRALLASGPALAVRASVAASGVEARVLALRVR